ncbi:hypothetical protein EPN29_09620 [bacterium]|nr:MAG: hypothetical protein EPN29_09620 [bacterium]
MSEHEALESSVAAWVLGALEQPDAEDVRIHLEGCSSCRETAGRLRRTVGALPLVVEEVAPPDRLRERVLAAAAASRGATTAPSRTWSKVRPVSRPSRPLEMRIRDRVPAYAAAAAVLIALLAGLVGGELAGRGSPPPAANQVARFTLVGHQGLAGARATVIDLKSDGIALVDFSGLPALPAGRVYEVWLIAAGGRAEAAAVFVPDANGAKVVVVNRALAGYTEMAITSEAGPDGSTAPTQQPQLYGNLA